ncbi:RsmB/NOP family class I SAM-dependent RNA methyltransferase [Sphingobacterium sp. lm-10]|uniref:RsmB/NOP family class I SAM-dependent RNA methyltransferase n=1 Tax=Sphingobacterium sp. lm-10 TaxID=2944904 RepID=UPI0020202B03|nr:RsmB/NOP family class I SAM-dependent RNA methyltransferase [Sphingobacterium sp. lm-10]MCL7986750.1 RsmB/NOP family class I SAM-dependent RNA methyltransferase [Sphingobacterium sp. lm-10]
MLEKRVMHQIRNAIKVLENYRYGEPLSRFLTKFYKSNRQMGSTDRRITSRLCYNYFRLGAAFTDLDIEEKLVVAEFLCEQKSDVVSVKYPAWNTEIAKPVEEKIALVEERYGKFLQDVFRVLSDVSSEVNTAIFIPSLFIQPKLFIRVKRANLSQVLRVLQQAEVPHEHVNGQTIAFPNGFNVAGIREIAGMYEVQDLSSQRTQSLLHLQAGEAWWDCCAASGGKSLMMLDQCPGIKLLVSDIRLTILRNLQERFEQAGISNSDYRQKILDLSQPVIHLMEGEQFDGILVDAPCTGSGTWGRTPEMMMQFDAKSLSRFSHLQRDIIRNVLPFLKSGGQLLYITCSVFADENEVVTSYVKQNYGLQLIHEEYLLGYGEQADSMYIARFQKN